MDFQEFLQFVPKIVNASLPALQSHLKMGPLERLQHYESIVSSEKVPKMAGVLMLFYPKNNSPHIVLIIRNSYIGIHSAQIAFPGGKHEIDDIDFAFTALRETHEEIGVESDKIEIIKAFTKMYITPSNFLVYPFLGISKEELDFKPDPSEVSEIIELFLSVLLNDATVVNTNVSTSYLGNIDINAFEIENKIVWGATAMMLSELKDVINEVLSGSN